MEGYKDCWMYAVLTVQPPPHALPSLHELDPATALTERAFVTTTRGHGQSAGTEMLARAGYPILPRPRVHDAYQLNTKNGYIYSVHHFTSSHPCT